MLWLVVCSFARALHFFHRINRVISKVCQIAFRDFSNSHLRASCAALIEMLGRDSTSFRVDLQCAERIARHTDGQQQQQRKG